MTRPSPAWRELDERRRFGTWRQGVVLAVVFGAVALLYGELRCASVRAWLVDHPATVALTTGLALLALTVLAVERVVAIAESRVWRVPALTALDAYVFSADRASQRIYSRLFDLVRGLPSPPVSEPRLREAFELLLEQDRARLVVFSEFVREQTDSLAIVSMTAMQTLARHEPYADLIQRLAEQQRRLADAADRSNFLSFIGSGLAGPNRRALEEQAAQHIATIDASLQGFVAELHTMRLQVMDAQVPRSA